MAPRQGRWCCPGFAPALCHHRGTADRPARAVPPPTPSPDPANASPAADANAALGHGADAVDTSYLQAMVGFNARMAALAVIGHVLPGLAAWGLRIVDFSILCAIGRNPGITSRQLCDALNLLPPNLVGKIGLLEKRGLLLRRPHPLDGRAFGLHLSDAGQALLAQAEAEVARREGQATAALSAAERKTLIRLLRKLWSGA